MTKSRGKQKMANKEEKKTDEQDLVQKAPKFPGRGLDVGTMWLASAWKENDGAIKVSKIRDAFLDLENRKEIRQMLKMSNANYVEKDDQIIIVGDRAMEYANLFKKEVRRPLSQGVIAAGEIDAQEILTIIIKDLLGEPRVEEEIVHFSVPAEPIDKSQKTIYHQRVFKKIVSSLGYKPLPMNEAAAISFSNAAKDNFSAIAISFGAGMCNVNIMYQALSGLEFSIARGGDWIDEQSADAVGTTKSRIVSIKEENMNLMDPSDGDKKYIREREAIMFHYQALIEYALDTIVKQFKKVSADFVIPHPIPLIIAGGTSMAEGFVELFKKTFEEYKGFPIDISEVRHATDPLFAVSQGLLVASLNYDDDDDE